MFASSCRSRQAAGDGMNDMQKIRKRSKLEKVFDPMHALFVDYGILRDSTPEAFCNFFKTYSAGSLKDICSDSVMYKRILDISDSISIQLKSFKEPGTLNETDVAEMDSFLCFTAHYVDEMNMFIEKDVNRFTPDSIFGKIMEDLSCDAYAKPYYRAFGLSLISSLCLFSGGADGEIPAKNSLQRQLPPVDTLSRSKVRSRNVLTIKAGIDTVYCNGKAIRQDEIKPLVKRFFLNPDNDTLLSEKSEKYIEGLGLTEVSKGVVQFTNMRGTSYGLYVKVQNEIAAAINELRDEFSRKTFGISFDQLSEEKRKAVSKKFPVAVSEAEPQ